jgi:hypothetical protein
MSRLIVEYHCTLCLCTTHIEVNERSRVLVVRVCGARFPMQGNRRCVGPAVIKGARRP